MAPSPAIAGSSAASAFFSNANGRARPLRRADLMVGTDHRLPQAAPPAGYPTAVPPDTRRSNCAPESLELSPALAQRLQHCHARRLLVHGTRRAMQGTAATNN